MRQILTRKLSMRRFSRMEGEAQRRALIQSHWSAIARIDGESKTQAPSRFSLLFEHDLRANAFRVCREEKPVPTFRDHALSQADRTFIRSNCAFCSSLSEP